MSKKVLVIVERGSDGTFACYNETPIGVYSLIAGDGASVSEAKSDFLKAVESCRLAYPEDDCYKDLIFEYRYDLSSFF